MSASVFVPKQRPCREETDRDGNTTSWDRGFAPFNQHVAALQLVEFNAALRTKCTGFPGVHDIPSPGLDGHPLSNYAWLACGVQATSVDRVLGEIGLKFTCPKFSHSSWITNDDMHNARCCMVGLLQILRRAHNRFWEPDVMVTVADFAAYQQDPYKLSCDALLWLTAALDWVTNLTQGHFPHAPYLAYVWALF
jgi:hypothetical protein